MFAEAGEDGQREGRGLAGAGLGRANEVTAAQDDRNSPELDRRWIDVAHGFDPVDESGR